MDEEQARRINEVFERALDLEGGARATYVARFGEETREAVERLLRTHDSLGNFLDEPAPERLEPRPLEPGTRIGAYRVVARIGSGSGGAVYEAEQESPRRRVALKLRVDPLGSTETHRRFREEAEILARLQHPAIAHVYEAGLHGDVPFFAMELVPAARTITEYAAGLTRAARLRLFTDLCDAVHHGHLKGVVHRDLKPGNILVLPDGRLKIIDFGIARVEGVATAFSALVGTPPYMSPEQCQARNSDVDARADVYALGVLLYELLTGALPHETRGLPITEAFRRIRETAPLPLPSSIPKDLAAIVGKALRKDREKRYDSAAQLGQDVVRFLESRPVDARPPGLAHGMLLFARRHRTLCLFSLLLFAVLVAAVVVSSSYAVRAEHALVRENAEAYVAQISAADAALRLLQVNEARRRLRVANPALRGWEWNHLVSRLDESEACYELPGNFRLVFHPDGRHVFFTGENRGNPAYFVARFDTAALVGQDWLPESTYDPVTSPDGNLVALGYTGGRVEWRDARTMKPVAEFTDHADRAYGIAFSPDGKLFASCSHDGLLAVRDVATRKIVFEHRGPPLHHVRFSPDGAQLACSHHAGPIELWSVARKERLFTLNGHRSQVSFLGYVREGRALVSTGADARIRIWDAASGRLLSIYGDRDASIWTAALLPDRKRLLTGHGDGSLTLWDLDTGLVLRNFVGHSRPLLSMTLAPDGSAAITTAYDQRIRVWSVANHDAAPRGDYGKLVRDVEYHPGGSILAAAVWDGSVRLHGLDRPAGETTLEGHVTDVSGVAFSEDGALLASAARDEIRIWDVAKRTCLHVLPTRDGRNGSCVRFDPSGSLLFSGEGHGEITLWEIGTKTAVRTFGIEGPVYAMQLSSDRSTLAAVTSTGHFRAWDWRTGREVARLPQKAAKLTCLEFSRDGGRLALGGAEDVYVLDARDWTLLNHFVLPAIDIQGVSWSARDERLAVGSQQGIRIVDPRDGRTLLTHPTQGWVWDVAFSPDGTQLAAGVGTYEGGYCRVELLGRRPGMEWPPEIDAVVPREQLPAKR